MLGDKAKHVEKPKRKRGEYTIYRSLGILRAWGCLSLVFTPLMLMTLILVIVDLHWIGLLFGLVTPVLLCAVLQKAYHYALGNRLIVESEGIEFHVYGQHGFTTWHNLRCFGEMGMDRKGRATTWGIVFENTVPISTSTLARTFAYLPRLDREEYNWFLPLAIFSHPRRRWILFGDISFEYFRRTPLGQDLFYYAPHLFKDVKQKRKRA